MLFAVYVAKKSTFENMLFAIQNSSIEIHILNLKS